MIFSEKPLVLRLVNIEVLAMVVSLTISPVSRNMNIDGIKRKEELFSTISGFLFDKPYEFIYSIE